MTRLLVALVATLGAAAALASPGGAREAEVPPVIADFAKLVDPFQQT